MKVLLTGCAGYIGSVLSDKLLNNYDFVGVDNLRFEQPLPKAFQKTKFIQTDLTILDNVKKVIDEVKPDVVIHLAGMVGMPICNKYPVDATMVNVESARLLLHSTDESVRFLYPNSNSMYGTVKEDILCDELTPCNPISLYAVTKCIAEDLVLTRKNSVSLRLATVYGVSETRMRSDLLINSFVKILVETGKLDIFEHYFKRNFIHIEDVANAFIFAIEHPEMSGKFNLGDDKLNTTKGELAKNIANIVGGEVTFNANGEDPDKRNYNISSSKLYSYGYQIQTNFTESILKLKEYYERNKK